MKYTVQGTFRDRPIELTWENGTLSGDEIVCRLLEIESRLMDTTGPSGGPYTTEDHLSNPLSALFIIEVLVNIVEVSGEVPTIPDVPDGAIP